MGRSFDIARRSRPPEQPSPTPKPRRKAEKSFGIGNLIFLAVIFAAGTYYVLNRGNVSSGKPASKLTPTSITTTDASLAIETMGPTPSRTTAAPATTPTASTSTAPIPTPTETTATDLGTDLRIKIYNGSGTSGAANTVRDQLAAAGFTIDGTATAKNRYPTSVIYYQNAALSTAQALKKELSTYSISLQESTAIKPDDIWVVIGSK